jgi:leucine-rich PPR motif-containing protein
MQILNADYWNSYLKPYMADLGVALVFGVGYYLFNKINKDKGINPDVKEKIKNGISKWAFAKTIQKFNSLIISNKDKTVDAFTILNNMQKSQVNPDIITYNCLLDMSFKLEQFEQAKKLYEEMSDFTSPVQPDAVTYNILLKGCVNELRECGDNVTNKANALKKAKYFITEMKNRCLQLNDITYNTIIDACVEGNDFDTAWGYYKEMETNGVQPDLYTYATLIKGLKSITVNDESNLNKVVEILEMIKEGKCGDLQVDEVLYNSVLDTCIKFNKIELAESLYMDMKERAIKPSIITYSILIKGYGIIYNFEKANALFNEMKEAQIKPNDIIYGCLLNCAARCSKLDKMNEIYCNLKADGIEPNTIIYTTMIKGYNKLKIWDKAFELFDSIPKDAKMNNSIVVYNAILDVCVESKNFNKLYAIYSDIKKNSENEGSAQPNLITYSTVMKGFSKAGQIDEVRKLYIFLKDNKYLLDEVLFNTVADTFARNGDKEGVNSVLQDMVKYGVKKTAVIYSILIKMSGNDESRAQQLFNEMEEQGIKPSLVTYTTLMQLYIRNKKLKEALRVFEELKSKGYRADQVTYNFIINGCTFNQKLEKAIEILIESIYAGIKINDESYKNVCEYLTTNKFMKPHDRSSSAQGILKAFREKGFHISDEIYNKFAKLIYKSGENVLFNETRGSENSGFCQKGKDDLIKKRKHIYK